MYGRCLHRTKSKGVMTMKQIDKSVNSLVRKIKQDERLKDFTFVKGFSTVEHPDPLSGYLIAVSTLDIGVGTRLDALDALLLRNLRRDDDDGDMVDHLVGPHASAELQTIHVGHHHVGHY